MAKLLWHLRNPSAERRGECVHEPRLVHTTRDLLQDEAHQLVTRVHRRCPPVVPVKHLQGEGSREGGAKGVKAQQFDSRPLCPSNTWRRHTSTRRGRRGGAKQRQLDSLLPPQPRPNSTQLTFSDIPQSRPSLQFHRFGPQTAQGAMALPHHTIPAAPCAFPAPSSPHPSCFGACT